MKIEAVSYLDVGTEAWDRFCLENSGAWFFSTSHWLEYQLARPEASKNVSFGILLDGQLAGICPMIHEGLPAGGTLSMEGHGCPWPTIRDWLPERNQVTEAIRTEVDRRASCMRARAACFRSSPLCMRSVGGENGSLKKWASRVADLTEGEAKLHAGLRKSYTSIINKGRRELEFTEGSPDDCRALHARAAGKETRPSATWRMMGEWWWNDRIGLPLVARRRGQPVGFAYFIVYKSAAYYASAAALEPNAGHALLWEGIIRLKARGVGRLEIGWIGHGRTPKEKAIEFFKSGFPGTDVSVIEIERCYR